MRPVSRQACLRMLAAAAAIASLAASGGCRKVLFPKDAPRSQFESYDTMRQRFVPMETPDLFGKPRPALRARLTPPTQ
jgi:hypothetical protein